MHNRGARLRQQATPNAAGAAAAPLRVVAGSQFVTQDDDDVDDLHVSGMSQSTAAVAANEREVRAFLTRLREQNRAFYRRNGSEIEVTTADFCDRDDDAVAAAAEAAGVAELPPDAAAAIRAKNAAQRERWQMMARREFGRRQRAFAARFESPSTLALYIAVVVAVALVLAAAFWPLWDGLLDVEADQHLAALGLSGSPTPSEIKKAYRAMAKRWHPDANPGCGEPCRVAMMRVQEAHDVLLARGDRSNHLAQKYKEALQTLRGLCFARAYGMAFGAAEFAALLLLARGSPVAAALPPGSRGRSWLRNGLRYGTMAAFVLCEMIFVTGPDPMLLLVVFYMLANAMRMAQQQNENAKVLRCTYVDIARDFRWFVLPAVAAHTLMTYGLSEVHQRDSAKYFFQLFAGVMFLAGFLSRTTPNVFDNFALRRCTVAQLYVSSSTMRVTPWQVITTELGLIADDAFAFASYVPAPYRLVVIAVHVAYLAQMALLPWDAPAVGKLQRRARERAAAAAARSASGGVAASPRAVAKESDSSDSDAEATSEDGSATATATTAAVALQPLRPGDAALFQNLDNEGVVWLDVALARYSARVAKWRAAFESAGRPFELQLVASPDLREVFLLARTQRPNPAGGPPMLHQELRDRFVDPAAARAIAREAGPNSVMFFLPGQQVPPGTDAAALQRRFDSMAGADTRTTTRLAADLRAACQSSPRLLRLVVSAAAVSVVLAAVFGVALSHADANDLRMAFDPSAPPVEPARFVHLLPRDNMLNSGLGGARVGATVALLAVDFWDALRQMALYDGTQVDPDTAPGAQVQTQQRQPEQAKKKSARKPKRK